MKNTVMNIKKILNMIVADIFESFLAAVYLTKDSKTVKDIVF